VIAPATLGIRLPFRQSGMKMVTERENSDRGCKQPNRPLAFFSQKLSPAQQKYSVTKQKLLAIVETLNSLKACFGVYNSQSIQITKI
jgi:hypothetical protein